MIRALTATMIALLGASLALCCRGPELESGTSTAWFSLCDANAPCESENLACICGRCTRPCDDDADCGEGTCASALSSIIQCNGAESGLVCIDPAICREMNVPAVATLGASVTPTCAHEGALLCEDFEALLPTEYSTSYDASGAGNEARLQDCRVHEGQGALRLQSAGNHFVQTRARMATAISQGPLYLRFYAYVPSSQPDPAEYLVVTELWDQEQFNEDKISVELGAGGSWRVVVGPSAATYGDVPGTLAKDTWSCVELDLNIAATGSIELRVDESPVVQVTDIMTQPANPFEVVTWGAVPDTAMPSFDLYLDDVVLSTSPIGCQ